MRNSIRDDALPWATLCIEGLARGIGWHGHCWWRGESIIRGVVEVLDRDCGVSPRDIPPCARGKVRFEKRQAARKRHGRVGCLFRANDGGEQEDCRRYKMSAVEGV